MRPRELDDVEQVRGTLAHGPLAVLLAFTIWCDLAMAGTSTPVPLVVQPVEWDALLSKDPPTLDELLDVFAPLRPGDVPDMEASILAECREPVQKERLLLADGLSGEWALLRTDDERLARALRWTKASSWTFYPHHLKAETWESDELPSRELAQIARSWLHHARESGDPLSLRAAIRLLRLWLDATLLPQQELEALDVLEEALVNAHALAERRGAHDAQAAAILAAEQVASRSVALSRGAFGADWMGVRVRTGLFGSSVADLTNRRFDGVLAHLARRRAQEGASRAALAGELPALWIAAHLGRSGVRRAASRTLEALAKDEDAAFAALADSYVRREWDASSPDLRPALVDPRVSISVVGWAFGARWPTPLQPGLVLRKHVGQRPLPGDMGPWLRSFTSLHRSRWSEIEAARVRSRGSHHRLPDEHPILVEAERELGRRTCRFSKREASRSELSRLGQLVEVLTTTWLERAEDALANDEPELAAAQARLALNLLARMEGDPSTGLDWLGSVRTWSAQMSMVRRGFASAQERALSCLARAALAAGDTCGALEFFRQEVTTRRLQRDSWFLQGLADVEIHLKHGSPSEALIKQPRVSQARFDWLVAIAQQRTEFDLRRRACRSLWFLVHEGTRALSEQAQRVLKDLEGDPDARVGFLASELGASEPTSDDLDGFAWDTFGIEVLDGVPIPTSWWIR